MATHLSKLKKRNGDIILPVTRSEGVILSDNSTTLDTKLTSLDTADSTNSGNLSTHVSNTSNPHGVTASQVGLGNVTNESKATMFTSPTFTGTPTISGSGRVISDSASSGTDVYYIWSGTQAQYDAIVTKDDNTLYFIVG